MIIYVRLEKINGLELVVYFVLENIMMIFLISMKNRPNINATIISLI